jgi:amino-acid N-acetyltransferase
LLRKMKRTSAAPPPDVAIGGAGTLAEIKALLSSCRLPTDDIRHDGIFVVARAGAQVCGTAGIERFGASALLRSVAVQPAWRGRGIAHALCDEILRRASAMQVRRVFLLTTDAQRFFHGIGFAVVDRASLPPEIRATAQFRELCPQTAAAMARDL